MVDLDEHTGLGPDDMLHTTEELETFDQSLMDTFPFITKGSLDGYRRFFHDLCGIIPEFLDFPTTVYPSGSINAGII